jgi:CRP-like cAMP-binding protein
MSEESSRPSNYLLQSLSENTYQRLAPHLTSISLPLGTTIYHPLDKVETAYFPENSLFSIITILENGTTTESGLVGRTGMLGLPCILGSGYTNNRVVVQVADSSVAIPAHILKREFDRGEELHKILLLYTEARLSQVCQQVACNAQHTIQERLARWLLLVQDLLSSDELPLTQEFISQMLGVRRSSVTVKAQTLQEAGIIHYTRGKVTILNQEALENTSCECYKVIKAEFHRILGFN